MAGLNDAETAKMAKGEVERGYGREKSRDITAKIGKKPLYKL